MSAAERKQRQRDRERAQREFAFEREQEKPAHSVTPVAIPAPVTKPDLSQTGHSTREIAETVGRDVPNGTPPEDWDAAEALKVWYESTTEEERDEFAHTLCDDDLHNLLLTARGRSFTGINYADWLYSLGFFEDTRYVRLPEGVDLYELDAWLRSRYGKGLDEYAESNDAADAAATPPPVTKQPLNPTSNVTVFDHLICNFCRKKWGEVEHMHIIAGRNGHGVVAVCNECSKPTVTKPEAPVTKEADAESAAGLVWTGNEDDGYLGRGFVYCSDGSKLPIVYTVTPVIVRGCEHFEAHVLVTLSSDPDPDFTLPVKQLADRYGWALTKHDRRGARRHLGPLPTPEEAKAKCEAAFVGQQ